MTRQEQWTETFRRVESIGWQVLKKDYQSPLSKWVRDHLMLYKVRQNVTSTNTLRRLPETPTLEPWKIAMLETLPGWKAECNSLWEKFGL